MGLTLCAGLAMELLSNFLAAQAKIKPVEYSGEYLWAGENYSKFQRTYMPGGYIDEYSSKEEFCTAWIYHPGLSLLGDGALGFCYLLFLVWLFIGIQILSDIFMEAIEEITSKSELIEIPDSEGNLIQVEK